MNLDRVYSGCDIPHDFSVIVEIPAHGEPIEYEVDKTAGAMFVATMSRSTPCRRRAIRSMYW